MNIQSLKVVYFSPTGTTKAILQGIAGGINQGPAEFLDITKPEARTHPLSMAEDDLLILGVPVYMGRVPALLENWLQRIRARRTPTVCVVVYGNRAYENALLELQDIVRARGCTPIAGAAYIGEHSFSSSELPTAQGRPDAGDLRQAEAFGRQIGKKLLAAPSLDSLSEAHIPGTRPYGGVTELWDVDFIALSDACTQQGLCAAICPVGAIDPKDAYVMDVEKCISCCACIKGCPQHARTMKDGPVKDAAVRLSTLYKERKEPECFL